MVREEIELVFNEDGTVETHIKGIKGRGCSKLALDIEKVLGRTTTTKNTEEYYQAEQVLDRGLKR